jgi:acyl-CoA reductase-like NAD-dependent aldehyde dehydrogenase
MYGQDMSKTQDFGRIINGNHFNRIQKLLDTSGGEIVYSGGVADKTTNFFPLTIVREPKLESSLMQDEIFGPILPIIAIENLDDAINFVNQRDKPLALYVFSESKSVADKIFNATSSGGACFNTCVFHISIGGFGGVGPSGMGAYHGKVCLLDIDINV